MPNKLSWGPWQGTLTGHHSTTMRFSMHELSAVLIFQLVERHMHLNFATVSLTEVELDLSQSILAQSDETFLP